MKIDLSNLNNLKNIDVKSELANLSYKKLVYPALLLVIIIVVFWSFYSAAQFLGTSITEALSTPSQSSLLSQGSTIQLVNMADYQSSIQKVASAPLPAQSSTSSSSGE